MDGSRLEGMGMGLFQLYLTESLDDGKMPCFCLCPTMFYMSLSYFCSEWLILFLFCWL